MKKNLYNLIYTNGHDFLYFIVIADNWFAAEKIAKGDVKQWDGFHVYAVNYLNRTALDAGEVVLVGG